MSLCRDVKDQLQFDINLQTWKWPAWRFMMKSVIN